MKKTTHYFTILLFWGYDAGIQLLETESTWKTWKTTLKNKRNFTAVGFASYFGCHKFLELLLKKTGNVERSKWLQIQKLENRITGVSGEDLQKKNLMGLLEDGEIKVEQDIPLDEFYFNVNKHLVSSLTLGTQSQ